jgi:hypothetical protein
MGIFEGRDLTKGKDNSGGHIGTISIVAVVTIVGIVAIFIISGVYGNRSFEQRILPGTADLSGNILTGHVVENAYDCIETDTGDDPANFGILKLGRIEGRDTCLSHDGVCTGPGCRLVEVYCSPNKGALLTREYLCNRNGCINGSCVPYSVPVKSGSVSECIDTDSGLNSYAKGNVTDTNGLYGEDYCTISFSGITVPAGNCSAGDNCFVNEYYCDGNRINYQGMACQSGCAAGACIRSDVPPENRTDEIPSDSDECRITKAYWIMKDAGDSITGDAVLGLVGNSGTPIIPDSKADRGAMNSITGAVVNSCPADLGACTASTACEESGGQRTDNGLLKCPGYYCRSFEGILFEAYRWVNSAQIPQCNADSCGTKANCQGNALYCTQKYLGTWGYYKISDIDFQTDMNNCGRLCNRCPSTDTCVDGRCVTQNLDGDCLSWLQTTHKCWSNSLYIVTDACPSFACNGSQYYCLDMGDGIGWKPSSIINQTCSKSDTCKKIQMGVNSAPGCRDNPSSVTCYGMGNNEAPRWLDPIRNVMCNDGSTAPISTVCPSGKQEVTCSMTAGCANSLGQCGPGTSDCARTCEGTQYFCGSLNGKWEWRSTHDIDAICTNYRDGYTDDGYSYSCATFNYPSGCARQPDVCWIGIETAIPSSKEVCSDLSVADKGGCTGKDLTTARCVDPAYVIQDESPLPPMGTPEVLGIFRSGISLTRDVAEMIPVDPQKAIGGDIIKIRLFTSSGQPYPSNVTVRGRSYRVTIMPSYKIGNGEIMSFGPGGIYVEDNGTLTLGVSSYPNGGPSLFINNTPRSYYPFDPQYVRGALLPGPISLVGLKPNYQDEYYRDIGYRNYSTNVWLANIMAPPKISLSSTNVDQNSILTITGGPFDFRNVNYRAWIITDWAYLDFDRNSSATQNNKIMDQSFLYYCNSTQLQLKLPPGITGNHTLTIGNGYGKSNSIQVSISDKNATPDNFGKGCMQMGSPTAVTMFVPSNGTVGSLITIQLMGGGFKSVRVIFYNGKEAIVPSNMTWYTGDYPGAVYTIVVLVPPGAETGPVTIIPSGRDSIIGPVFTVSGNTSNNVTPSKLPYLVVESTGCAGSGQKPSFRIQNAFTGAAVSTVGNAPDLSDSPTVVGWDPSSTMGSDIYSRAFYFYAFRIKDGQAVQAFRSRNFINCPKSNQGLNCSVYEYR